MIITTNFNQGIEPGSCMWMVGGCVVTDWLLIVASTPHRSHLLSPTRHTLVGTLYYGNNQGQFIKARALPRCRAQWWTVKWAEAHWGITSARNAPSAPKPCRGTISDQLCTILLLCCCCVSFTLTHSFSHTLNMSDRVLQLCHVGT